MLAQTFLVGNPAGYRARRPTTKSNHQALPARTPRG